MNRLMLSVFFLSWCISCKTASVLKPRNGSINQLQRVTIIGHRGSPGADVSENNISSFKNAIAEGATIIELDLHLTKDDVPLVTHDGYMSPGECRTSKGRTNPEKIEFSTLTAEETQTYDCGVAGHKEAPLLFRDLLRWMRKEAPSIDMLVEIKNGKEADHFMKQVVEVLQAEKELHHAIFISFEQKYLDAIRVLEPSHAVGRLTGHPQFCASAAQRHEQYVLPKHTVVTAEEVELCHSDGIRVYVWTPNTEAEWEAVLAKDIDGIITDRPDLLSTYLSKSNTP